jgi:hypothetical protein
VSVQYIERVAHVAPVGLRLVDTVTGRSVSEDVSVRIVPQPPGRPTTAIRTSSGVFGAHGLPGLRRFELRDVGPDGLPEEVDVEPLPFRIEVRDASERFHSFAASAELPSDGLLSVRCGSPPGSPPSEEKRSLPLYSRPGRTVPPGTAVVRARLLYEADRAPAAYAALEVVPRAGAAPVRGIADERGEVAVMFPYPQPAGFVGSPPAGTKRPLASSTWTITVDAFAPRVGSPPEEGELPDLCTFLDQSPATLLTAASPPTELAEATLEYGRELVLRSSPEHPELLVRP